MRREIARLVSIVLLAVVVIMPAGALAQDATPTGAEPGLGGDLQLAVDWLQTQQLEDGAFAGFSGEADPGTTVDAVIALAAAEAGGADTGDSIDLAIEYLSGEGVAQGYQETGVGQAAKLVLALVAAGENPADFAGINPLETVENGQDSETGLYGLGVYDHAYALMALAVTGSDVDESAVEALVATQADNGGWAFDASTEESMADSNTTSMVIQALVATGNGDHQMIQGGLEYLLTVISDNGAGYSTGAEADGNSTALVAQAYIATQGDATTLQANLTMYQLPSGAYFYQQTDPTENSFTTMQVLPAVADQAFPIMPEGAAAPDASPEATPSALMLQAAA